MSKVLAFAIAFMGLVLVAPTSQAARFTEEGQVNFPTVAPPVLPGAQAIVCLGCTVYRLDAGAVAGNPGRPFTIATTSYYVAPDFDVYFYSDTLGLSLLEAYDGPGDPVGNIPAGAARGFVVMKIGLIAQFEFTIF